MGSLGEIVEMEIGTGTGKGIQMVGEYFFAAGKGKEEGAASFERKAQAHT